MVPLRLGHPDEAQSRESLRRHEHAEPSRAIAPVLELDQVRALQAEVLEVRASEAARAYITALTLATRDHPSVALPASPRASVMLLRAAQAMALCEGRGHVLPDDVKAVAPAVLTHRLGMGGPLAEEAVGDILDRVPVPLASPASPE